MSTKETEEEKKARELVEEIATTIAKLSRQVSAILEGRLKKESIITLLVHSTKLPRRDIGIVLDAVVDLEKDHLKK